MDITYCGGSEGVEALQSANWNISTLYNFKTWERLFIELAKGCLLKRDNSHFSMTLIFNFSLELARYAVKTDCARLVCYLIGAGGRHNRIE